jgi:hypothetical protein
MTHRAGRAVLCVPRTWKNLPLLQGGAHGVTRPTVSWFRELKFEVTDA